MYLGGVVEAGFAQGGPAWPELRAVRLEGRGVTGRRAPRLLRLGRPPPAVVGWRFRVRNAEPLAAALLDEALERAGGGLDRELRAGGETSWQAASGGQELAVGETVILLHLPLPPAGVSIGMWRGRQQNMMTVSPTATKSATCVVSSIRISVCRRPTCRTNPLTALMAAGHFRRGASWRRYRAAGVVMPGRVACQLPPVL